MMKKILFLFIAFCINITTALTQEKIWNLEKYFNILEDSLSLNCEIKTGIIDVDKIENLETVDSLYFSNAKIINFQEIKRAENLEYLFISYCSFDSSIEVISELKKLEKLIITFCELVDINFLGKIKTLKELALDYNNISDISSLISLSKLIYLNLLNNKISDFSPISNLSNIINTTNLLTDRSVN
jgi:internalin A